MAIARYPRRGTAARAAYARTNADLLVNDPNGFPSGQPPISWVDGADAGGNFWWIGSDAGGGAEPIGPNGPWPYGCAPLPAVTRATALITGPLTAAPFELIDPADPGRNLDEPRWMTDPMLLRPDERIGVPIRPAVTTLARSIFWAEWVRNAVWWGEGAFVYISDSAGQPIAGTLAMVHPGSLQTEGGQAPGDPLRWVIQGVDGEPDAVFDRYGHLSMGGVDWRISVLRNPHSPVGRDGRSLGVFAMNPAAFRLGRQIQSYSSGTFRSGIPAGYLKVSSPDASQKEITELKQRWLRSHGGDRRSIAVLNAVTEFVPLNLSPVDAELAQVERLNIAEIAFAFGLSPETLGVTLANSMVYSNVRDAWLNHRDFGLAPWIAAVQDTLTALTPAGQQVLVDLDGFANPTRQERYNAYKTALDAGVMTVDEIRELEGLGPMPESEKSKTPPQLLPFTGEATTYEESNDETQESA